MNGVLLAVAASCWAQRAPVSPELLSLARPISQARLSADGRSVSFLWGGEAWSVPARGGWPSRALPETGSLFIRDGQLWLDERQLTREPVEVKRPVPSPDGKTVAVVRTADDQKGEVLLVPFSGEAVEVPPPHGGMIAPLDYSPDGHELLCRAHNPKGFLQLYLLDVRTLRGRFIGADDADVEDAVYHPAAGVIYRDGGLKRLPKLLGKPEAMQPAKGHVESFSVDARGNLLAYVWSDSVTPSELWLLDLRSGHREKLSRAAPAGLKPEALSRASFVRYPTYDGRDVEALYLRPGVKRLGDPPPLVVEIHDGPDRRVVDEFSARRQALAEAGFAVLAPNFRGSTGRGRPWQELNRSDWGGGDRRDLVEGVKWLAKRGEVDAARVGLVGEGWGGYMASYALSAGTEFKAAASIRGFDGVRPLCERRPDWCLTQMGAPGPLYDERSPKHDAALRLPSEDLRRLVDHFVQTLAK